MDLNRLAHFLRVVDAGGFSRAAVQLDCTQSTLSRQIGLLEADLGQRLLTRTGRGVVPTEAGRALVSHARALLELEERAREALRGLEADPHGRVTVGLPPRVAHAIAALLVRRFRERFPRAVITVAEALSVPLRDWLVSGRIDVALLFDPPASPQLDCRTLAREPLVLVAPGRGPKLPRRLPLAAIAGYPLVMPSAPNALRSLLDAAADARGIALDVVAEVDSVHTVLSIVDAGAGCTVMPASGVQGYGDAFRLRTAPIVAPVIRNRLVLAVPKARPHTRLTRETVELLTASEIVDRLRLRSKAT